MRGVASTLASYDPAVHCLLAVLPSSLSALLYIISPCSKQMRGHRRFLDAGTIGMNAELGVLAPSPPVHVFGAPPARFHIAGFAEYSAFMLPIGVLVSFCRRAKREKKRASCGNSSKPSPTAV